MRTFTVEELEKSVYVSGRWRKPWGIVVETVDGHFGTKTKVVVLKLRDIFERIADCKPIENPRSIPYTIDVWMSQKGIAGISSLEYATRELTSSQKSIFLQGWFNGGGYPSSTEHWHPALLQAFIDWVICLLTEFNSIDGRINKRGEIMINAARACNDMGKVKRFP